ncbi:MAG: hypothetical protein DRQ14_05105 [Candidatus Latescibacterota bacterium]|nr:MAG: hypothetical protein DRQ14_05105 [Candidatus Latescibacterota bacterium]
MVFPEPEGPAREEGGPPVLPGGEGQNQGAVGCPVVPELEAHGAAEVRAHHLHLVYPGRGAPPQEPFYVLHYLFGGEARSCDEGQQEPHNSLRSKMKA